MTAIGHIDATAMTTSRITLRSFLGWAALTAMALAAATLSVVAQARPADDWNQRNAQVSAVKLHCRAGGQGSAAVLLYGYDEATQRCLPLAGELVQRHAVIVPKFRSARASDQPASSCDKITLAQDVHVLVESPG